MNAHTPRPLRVVLCAACLAAACMAAAAHSSAAARPSAASPAPAAPAPAAPAPPAPAAGAEKDAAFLLDGVGRIAAPGVPGPLCVFGDKAFAVVAGKSGEDLREPVVAAARLGAGRVVAFGHDGYFEAGGLAAADTGRFMLNAVRWVAGAGGTGATGGGSAGGTGAAGESAGGAGGTGAGAAAADGPRVAVMGQPGLLGFLRDKGIPAEDLGGDGWRDRLKGFQVLCVNPVRLSADEDFAAVSAFARAGGGLIVVGLGWGWQQLNPGKDLVNDHPASRLLGPAGIVWADGTLDHTAEGGYAAGTPPPALVHAGRALDAVLAHAAGKEKLSPADMRQAVLAVTRAARSLRDDDTLLRPRLRRVQEEHRAEAVPTAAKAVTADQPLARLLLTLQVEEARRLPPEKVRAHPAAAEFPGAVPAGAPRVTRTVDVDTAVPDWHSTGLYAPPGEVVTVTVPEAAAAAGLRVRIGAHSDTLWHLDRWHRCPEICRTVAVTGPVTRAAGAFGGLVYIDVPRGCKAGTVAVRLAGAVEAPYYERGVTSAEAWRKTIRGRPAPWAELATGKVVLTLPSKAVRGLDDPEPVLAFWDRVLDACADLAATATKRERPERFVTDLQISAGYMHSGYPLMTLLDMPDVMVDTARLKANGHGGVWGLFHELGHNHQSGDWTFGGTGEVTVNLFTMYVFDTVCGLAPTEAHGAVADAERARNLKAYAAAPDFEKWKRDPFLALVMYIQLQEAFGWDAYKKVFAEYRTLAGGERPRSDEAKRDQWMVRMSRTVGRNLGPFFEAWAVPTTAAARASVADLPAWMPEGFPAPKP